MRLRKVPYATELLSEYPEYVVKEPKRHSGIWNSLFDNENPIELEIGSGKGKFIYEKAENNVNINYIGIEKFDSVLVRALEKMIYKSLPNLKLIRFDAQHINEIFSNNEISNIYLNFSDPWPKKRQEKRRLTSPIFLRKYAKILKPFGAIHLKTDNYCLFEYSMMSLNESEEYIIEKVVLDLYQDLPIDNVQTEFEMRFIQQNKPIYYIKAKFKGETE